MRIAMLTGHRSTDHERSGHHLMPVASALAERGHEVVVMTPEEEATEGSELPPGVRVESVDAGAADDPAMPRRYGAELHERWRSDPPDVVHAFTWSAGLAAITAQTDKPVPLVQDYRWSAGAAPDGIDPARLRRLQAALGRHAQQAVVSGARQADTMARWGVPRTSISVVPYGVDAELYHPEGSAHRSAEHRQLVCPDGPDDGHSSEEVVRALPRVPDAELVIADRHAEPGGEIRELAESLGVGDRVNLLTDLTDEELAELYRSADLVVSTPSDDADASACAEAMACGAPLVATAVDARADLVVEGVTGVLVPSDSSEQLANAVRRLLDDEPRRLAYGIAGADRVAACYTWDRVVGDLTQVYESAGYRGRYTTETISGTFTG